jgi:putative phosphoribosyl transferase
MSIRQGEVMAFFTNRTEAGQKLASALQGVADKDALVLAVPRGGVVVGYEVARALNLELDVIITKKIGAPGNPELAIGAVAEDGFALVDAALVSMVRAPKDYVEAETERQTAEIQRRLKSYRQNQPTPKIAGRQVILVDDGIATGSTLTAAIRSLKKRGAKTVTVAVPVGPPEVIRNLKQKADQVVCLFTPEPFYAIGEFYDDFNQTTDQEVIELLSLCRKQKAKVTN